MPLEYNSCVTRFFIMTPHCFFRARESVVWGWKWSGEALINSQNLCVNFDVVFQIYVIVQYSVVPGGVRGEGLTRECEQWKSSPVPRHWMTWYDSTRAHSGNRRMRTHSAPARRPQRRAKSCETEVSQNESGETHIGGYLFLQKLLPGFLPFWCKKATDKISEITTCFPSFLVQDRTADSRQQTTGRE